MKEVNYTQEMTDKAVSMYQEGGNAALDTIAEALNRSVASVRSKLVREGVYKADPKTATAKKDNGPTKADLLETLESVSPDDFVTDDFKGANKAGISWLIEHFGDASEA